MSEPNREMSPAFAEALVKTQGEIEGAKKGKENTFFKVGGKNAKYADLSSCWDACRDALQANRIAVLQLLCSATAGTVGIRTVLVYGPTGETVSSTFEVPLKDPTNPQALGSAVTYGRRYSLCAAIGICPDDDDGNAASGKAERRPLQAVPINQGLISAFDSAEASGNVTAMKAAYSSIKNSQASEPGKSNVLAVMAEIIKGATK